MNILGISCFYHDSASCLVRDGEIIAAAQEERFSRKKHDFNFPVNAVKYCFNAGGITAEDLDYVVFYDKPFIKFERILETYLMYAPSGVRQFIQAMPFWLNSSFTNCGASIKSPLYPRTPKTWINCVKTSQDAEPVK